MQSLSGEIYRNPADLEALKMKVREEYFADFERERLDKRRTIDALDNVIALKQSKRNEAEVPLTEKWKAIGEREKDLQDREKILSEGLQKVFERESDAEKKLESVQCLADQLGETRVRQMVKEKTLQSLEKALKENETQYLSKVERFSHEVNEAAARIQEKENAVNLKELNVQSQEENLVKREKELLDGHIWLNDQRNVLARAWSELKEKQQHGNSAKQLPKRR